MSDNKIERKTVIIVDEAKQVVVNEDGTLDYKNSVGFTFKQHITEVVDNNVVLTYEAYRTPDYYDCNDNNIVDGCMVELHTDILILDGETINIDEVCTKVLIDDDSESENYRDLYIMVNDRRVYIREIPFMYIEVTYHPCGDCIYYGECQKNRDECDCCDK